MHCHIHQLFWGKEMRIIVFIDILQISFPERLVSGIAVNSLHLHLPFFPLSTFCPCQELCYCLKIDFVPSTNQYVHKGLGELAMYNRHSVHFFVVRVPCARDCSTCCTLLSYVLTLCGSTVAETD